MRKTLLSLWKYQSKNYFLVETRFPFAETKITKTFFKKPKITNPIEKEKTLAEPKPVEVGLQKKESMDVILEQYDSYFNEARGQLPAFLRRLTRDITHQIFLKHQEAFDTIYYKINKYSSELILKPQQLLQIIMFIDSYLHFYSKQLPIETVIVNNGFEHRATILAAAFVFNREFTITQSIAVFKILSKIGSISILFVQNLTKILKLELQSENAKKVIKLEHILTILSVYFFKNNHTVLENVLYDLTLNYFLKNEYLTDQISVSFQAQTICLLLRMDLMPFYMSQKGELKSLLERNIDALVPKVRQSEQFSLHHAASLIESCAIYVSQHQNNSIHSKIKTLIKEIYELAQISLKGKKVSNTEILLINRILFNRRLIQCFPHAINVNLSVQLIYSHLLENNQRSYEGFITIYSNEMYKSIVVPYLSKAYHRMVENNFFFPAITQIMIEEAQYEQSLEVAQTLSRLFDKSESKLTCKDSVLLLGCLYLIHLKYGKISNRQNQQKLLTKLKVKVKRFMSNKLLFVKAISESILVLRSKQTKQMLFNEIFQGVNMEDFTKISHPNQFQRNDYLKNLLHILTESLSLNSNGQTRLLNKFKDHIIYSFMISLEPLNSPAFESPNQYFPFLDNDETFVKNVGIILTLAGKIEQYSYLIWEIFIRNYSFRSRAVRESSFVVLKQIFMTAFEQQTARKVVLLTTLTNFMSSGVIVAPKQKFRELLTACLLSVIQINLQVEKFHYHCFLHITLNALSVGILSQELFSKVANLYQSTINQDKGSIKTSLLMLLYGMTMKNSSKNVYLDYYQPQISYLEKLLKSKSIVVMNKKRQENAKSTKILNRNVVSVGAKYICVILSYGEAEILQIGDDIVCYIEECDDLSQFMMVLHSFKIQSFNLQNSMLRNFVSRLNQAFFNRIAYFYEGQVLSKVDYQEELKNIEVNRSKIEASEKINN